MRCEWEKTKLGEMVVFNPKLSLPKGSIAKKIAMEHLLPFSKYITKFELSSYAGGAKFMNGDTLLARITPCLENGKTSQVTMLDENEIGFGSTEFIVLRAKDGLSDKDFIYYLSISPQFRDYAIKSMVGSSGRQRVQQDVLENMYIDCPSIQEQKAIAAVLSALDDKIELNNRINKNLEAQAQAIFKSWFVDFEPFRDDEFVDSELGPIPKGWKVDRIGTITDISTGKRPVLKFDRLTVNTSVPIIGASGIMAYTNKYLLSNKIIVTGRVGTHGVVQRYYRPIWVSDNAFIITTNFYEYTYQVFKNINYSKLNRGSTQPLITQTDLKNEIIIRPPDEVLIFFEKTICALFAKVDHNNLESEKLATIRDTLLPKLMSGEIQVPLEV